VTAGSGRRRPGTGASCLKPAGRSTGPELHAAALGRQRRLADCPNQMHGTRDIRYTLQTDTGELLYVQSRGVRHAAPRSRSLAERGRRARE